MAVSPFTFYRGAAQLMASDLGRHPHTGIYAQMCGDAHLSNFGIYASPERTPVFDINDFDETSQGPWRWDLKRLTTSFVLAARDNGQAGRSEEAVRTAAGVYVAALNEMAGLGWLERRHRMVRADAPVAEGIVWTGKMTALVNQVVAKAVKRTQAWTVGKYTEVVDGAARLRLDPPVITAVSRRTAAAVTASLRLYLESLSAERRAYLRGYHVVDIAHKVVGVGSVGTYDYIVLLMGDGMRDQLLLQVKEAELSAVKTALGEKPRLAYGERVVVGAADAGHQRSLPRLDTASRAQLLRASAEGHEGVPRPGAAHRERAGRLRLSLRLHARPGSQPRRRPPLRPRLCWQGRCAHGCDVAVLGGLCRPD